VALKRNWYQQRNEHADLIIYTASGSERVNYLKLEEALDIVNYLNFKVENSRLSWI
jgi:putative membrane protein